MSDMDSISSLGSLGLEFLLCNSTVNSMDAGATEPVTSPDQSSAMKNPDSEGTDAQPCTEPPLYTQAHKSDDLAGAVPSSLSSSSPPLFISTSSTPPDSNRGDSPDGLGPGEGTREGMVHPSGQREDPSGHDDRTCMRGSGAQDMVMPPGADRRPARTEPDDCVDGNDKDKQPPEAPYGTPGSLSIGPYLPGGARPKSPAPPRPHPAPTGDLSLAPYLPGEARPLPAPPSAALESYNSVLWLPAEGEDGGLGGYPPELLVSPGPLLLCVLCHLVLRDPVQSPCGHRFCRSCLSIVRHDTPCASCTTEGETFLLDPAHLVPDPAARRELMSHAARCRHQGCEWRGNLRELLRHQGVCENRPCRFGCPGACSDIDHERSATSAHTMILLRKVTELQHKVDASEGDDGTRRHPLEEKVQKLEAEIQRTEEDMTRATEARGAQQGGGSGSVGDLGPLTERQTVLGSLADVLTAELEQLVRNQASLRAQHTEVTTKMDALQGRIRALQRGVAHSDVQLVETETRLKLQEVTSYSGEMVWVISGVSARRQEAVSRRVRAIDSPSFYTGRGGYKLGMRIHLDGEGGGQGSHVSLFLVIMRGQYDALLPWPFRQKVTLSLLDQGPSRNDVIDVFRPDPTSASFRRPQSEMNVGSGFPLFCPLSKLDAPGRQYIKDDVIFVKVSVDTTGL